MHMPELQGVRWVAYGALFRAANHVIKELIEGSSRGLSTCQHGLCILVSLPHNNEQHSAGHRMMIL